MQRELNGIIVSPKERKMFKGRIVIEDDKISKIISDESVSGTNYILPGLIDSHIHIESSMLVPSEFARAAVVHGTVATVSDPHEIANVLGVEGVEFMIENSKQVPFDFYFGVPSCVPATNFESAGANLDSADIRTIFEKHNLLYLSEMMNFPGVVYEVPEVIEKLEIARSMGKPIDGHAPALKGEMLRKYVSAGISTDHECFTLEEAKEKIALGMKILIREGSAAKNFDALKSLIKDNTNMCMLCSDDRHPDDLLGGHINMLVRRALSEGFDIFDILQTAVVNPIEHYKLQNGMLREGDFADLIVVDSLQDFSILETVIKGKTVAKDGTCLFDSIDITPINKFSAANLSISDIEVVAHTSKIRVIEAIEGELITNELIVESKIVNGFHVADIERDILKLVVYNRYEPSTPAVAFIKNIGLTKGALATSVAHDSHNIIAVGTNDEDLVNAINLLISTKGGMTACSGDEMASLPLPIAGIMSDESAEVVARKYEKLNSMAKSFGSKLGAPFMTLSFMALLVIPNIKLSDKGLFDGRTFSFTNLEC